MAISRVVPETVAVATVSTGFKDPLPRGLSGMRSTATWLHTGELGS